MLTVDQKKASAGLALAVCAVLCGGLWGVFFRGNRKPGGTARQELVLENDEAWLIKENASDGRSVRAVLCKSAGLPLAFSDGSVARVIALCASCDTDKAGTQQNWELGGCILEGSSFQNPQMVRQINLGRILEEWLEEWQAESPAIRTVSWQGGEYLSLEVTDRETRKLHRHLLIRLPEGQCFLAGAPGEPEIDTAVSSDQSDLRILTGTDILRRNGYGDVNIRTLNIPARTTWISVPVKKLPVRNELLYGTFPSLEGKKSSEDGWVHLLISPQIREEEAVLWFLEENQHLSERGLVPDENGAYGRYWNKGELVPVTGEDMDAWMRDSR